MVFGLFSRKREPAIQATNLSESTSVNDPGPSNSPHAQLRTPSPSVDSVSIGKQNSPSRDPPLTPSPPPEAAPELNLTDLRGLIEAIPPQTLRTYTLDHLVPSNSLHPDTLAHLFTFFSELTPPPRQHCVRCHKFYFDVENTDRSCIVPHDDESAEVERVSSKAKAKGVGTLYETLWGCCGRTVEGDGDMGPPDGWCYEGKHTTDVKRARFRADSTLQDDKLTSCERLRCHAPPRSARTERKRRRPVAEGDEDEERDEEGSTSSSASLRSSAGGRRGRVAKKPRTQHPAEQPEPALDGSDRMDVDEDVSPQAPRASPPKSKPKPRATPKTPFSGKALSTPKTSSPLVLAPPFVSRSVSPDPPSKGRIVTNMKPKPNASSVKPKSSAASLKPKSSAASLKSKPGSSKPSGSSTIQKPVVELPPSPGKGREKSLPPKERPKARLKGKTRGLAEVVDSSVDAERLAG
ncbi:hypothetical protein Hypma_013007 [Hypsizygus marmoreus]|uniref:Uncharacterized protein n=1 Tax=Hypsizygus marmoreus TaxID=39966 RepID=A0A369JER4_HYPMA|nr:hypothetical protein Hypma_013007 [Hypsizygus marmoreus]